jgi:hypothetical protein
MSTAAVVQFPSTRGLRCSVCDASASASCDCGAAYVPAGERAALAIAANPEKSDRAIAADIGVDHKTVAKARRAPGEKSPPAKRTGKDGKSYPAKPKPKKTKSLPADDPIQEPYDADCITDQQRWEWSLGHFAGDAVAMRAFWTREFGNWEKFEVSPELIKLAEQAEKAWAELVPKLKSKIL